MIFAVLFMVAMLGFFTHISCAQTVQTPESSAQQKLVTVLQIGRSNCEQSLAEVWDKAEKLEKEVVKLKGEMKSYEENKKVDSNNTSAPVNSN